MKQLKQLGLSEEETKELATRLSGDIEEAETDRKDREPVWNEELDFYNLKTKPRASTFNVANLMMPLVRSTCDAIQSRIHKGILGVTPIMTVEAPEVNDLARCRKNEKYLDYQLQIATPFRREFSFLEEDAVQIGTGILYLPWVVEKEKLGDAEEFEDIDKFLLKYPIPEVFLDEYSGTEKEYWDYVEELQRGNPITIEFIDLIETYNNPKPERINPFDFLITPGVLDPNRATLTGHKMPAMTYSELKMKEQTDEWDIGDIVEGIDEKKLEEHKFENIYQCIYRHDIDGDGIAEKLVLVYDRDKKAIAKGKMFPYHHNRVFYIPYYIKPDRNSFWGKSLISVLKDLNKAVNNVFNLIFDAATLANTPMFKAVKDPTSPFRGLQKFYAGKVWWCKSLDEFEQLRISGASMDAVQLIVNIERYAEMVSSVVAYTLGRSPAADPRAPAKKAELAIQEAGYVLGNMIDNIGEGNKEMAFQMMELNYQFGNDELRAQVLGENEEVVEEGMTKQELLRRVNYKPVGTSASLEKAMRKEIDTEVYQTLRQEPEIVGSPEVPRHEAIRELIEAYLSSVGGDWDKHKDKLLPTDEDVEEQESKEAIYEQGVQAGLAAGVGGGRGAAGGVRQSTSAVAVR